MKKLILTIICSVILMGILLVGYAHSGCVVGPNNKEYCRENIPIIPSDFPEELFQRWWKLWFDITEADFNKDGYAEGYLGWFYSGNINMIGFIYFDKNEILALAWGFIEVIDGKAHIGWIADGTPQWKRDFLTSEVEKIDNSMRSNRTRGTY